MSDYYLVCDAFVWAARCNCICTELEIGSRLPQIQRRTWRGNLNNYDLIRIDDNPPSGVNDLALPLTC